MKSSKVIQKIKRTGGNKMDWQEIIVMALAVVETCVLTLIGAIFGINRNKKNKKNRRK